MTQQDENSRRKPSNFEQLRFVVAITGLAGIVLFMGTLCLNMYYFPIGIGFGIGIESPDLEAAGRSFQVLQYTVWGAIYGFLALLFIRVTDVS